MFWLSAPWSFQLSLLIIATCVPTIPEMSPRQQSIIILNFADKLTMILTWYRYTALRIVICVLRSSCKQAEIDATITAMLYKVGMMGEVIVLAMLKDEQPLG